MSKDKKAKGKNKGKIKRKNIKVFFVVKTKIFKKKGATKVVSEELPIEWFKKSKPTPLLPGFTLSPKALCQEHIPLKKKIRGVIIVPEDYESSHSFKAGQNYWVTKIKVKK